MAFDETDSIEATQVLALTPDDFSPSKATPLRFVKFQNVYSLTLFVEDNQDNSDVTALKSLTFVGSPIAVTGDIKQLKQEE